MMLNIVIAIVWYKEPIVLFSQHLYINLLSSRFTYIFCGCLYSRNHSTMSSCCIKYGLCYCTVLSYFYIFPTTKGTVLVIYTNNCYKSAYCKKSELKNINQLFTFIVVRFFSGSTFLSKLLIFNTLILHIATSAKFEFVFPSQLFLTNLNPVQYCSKLLQFQL